MELLGAASWRVRPRLAAPSDDEPVEPEVEPACPICKDFGFVRKDVPLGHPDFGRAIACSCREGEVRDRLRRRSQIGALADRSFDNFHPGGRSQLSGPNQRGWGEAWEGCRRYAEDTPFWLLLCGPT